MPNGYYPGGTYYPYARGTQQALLAESMYAPPPAAPAFGAPQPMTTWQQPGVGQVSLGPAPVPSAVPPKTFIDPATGQQVMITPPGPPAAVPTGAPTGAIVAEPMRAGPFGLTGKQQYALPGSPEAAQIQAGRQIATGAALSGAAQLAQLGAAFIPTAQEAENRRRLKELEQERRQLESEIEAGEFGLTPQQREAMEQAAVGRVGTMARESRMREEAAAAAGPATSAAAQVRARREERRTVQQAAQQAGAAIEQADIQQAAQQLQATEQKLQAAELERQQRIAYRGQRQRQLMELGARTIGEGAGLAGQIAGAQAIQGMDPARWAAMSPLEQQMYTNMMRGGDQQSMAWLALSRAIAGQKTA